MRRWRALVVDDEPGGRNLLVDLCGEIPELELVGVCEDAAEARAALAGDEIDLVFLDIQMPEGDGFEVVASLPAGRRPVVVFVTAHASFAARAFEAEAFDYLLKPFDAERFGRVVRRAMEELSRRYERAVVDRLDSLLGAQRSPGWEPERRIVVRSAGRITFLPIDEVEWVDAAGNSVRVHAGGTVHRVHETLARIEKQFNSPRFARIHRSTIVNLDRVRELLVSVHGDYIAVTDSGTRLTVGRQYRDRIQIILRGTASPSAMLEAPPPGRLSP